MLARKEKARHNGRAEGRGKGLFRNYFAGPARVHNPFPGIFRAIAPARSIPQTPREAISGDIFHNRPTRFSRDSLDGILSVHLRGHDINQNVHFPTP